jgi:HEAT repeat protein
MSNVPHQTGKRALPARLGILAAAVLVAVLAVAAWKWMPGSAGTASHRFVPGQRRIYKVEYLCRSFEDFSVLTAGSAKEQEKDKQSEARVVVTNIDADLEATVVEVNADGAVVAYAFRTPDVQIWLGAELANVDAIKTDLGLMMLAQLDRQGRIRSVKLDPKVGQIAHTLARALVADTQVVFGDNQAGKSWETREGNPSGEYVARYKVEAAPRRQEVAYSKEKLQYLAAPRKQSLRKFSLDTATRPSGSLKVTFDVAEGRLQAVEGEETTTQLVNAKAVARADSTLKVTFKFGQLLSRFELDKLTAQLTPLKAVPPAAITAAPPSSEEEAAIHRNELGDATEKTLLEELARLEAQTDASISETRLYLKVKALVYLHPESCLALANVLIAAKNDSTTMRIVMDALSSIGHAQAQAALEKVIVAKPDDEALLAELVPALAMVEQPTEATEAALRQLATSSRLPNIRAAAELGLGTMAYQLRAAEPARAAAIIRPMVAKLAKADTVELRRHYLYVIGNAGLDETLPPIIGYVSDANAELRAAAAAALRWIEDAKAEDLLCTALTSDSDTMVRVEAATSLGFRPMTSKSFAAQKTAFLKDSSSHVRRTLLPNFSRASSAFPEGLALLEQARKDESKEVRELAGNLLAID